MNKAQVEKEFRDGDISYIQAIEELEKIGIKSKEAEDLVETWFIGCVNEQL